MRRFFYFLMFLFPFSEFASAQQFVNGSFEQQNTAITPCSQLPVATYNAYMKYSYTPTSGTVDNVFVGGTGCGGAENGSYFIGVQYDNTVNGNIITMKLDNNLKPTTRYVFSFYKMASNTLLACKVLYGYTNDSMGNTIDHIYTADSVDTATSTVSWVKVIDTFTTPSVMNNENWFVLMGVQALAPGGILYLDNFKIESATNVTQINKPGVNINVYPNPFTAFTSVNINSPSSLPGKLIVYDILGTTIVNKTITEQNSYLDLSKAAKGIYIMKFIDRQNNNTTIKLINQ